MPSKILLSEIFLPGFMKSFIRITCLLLLSVAIPFTLYAQTYLAPAKKGGKWGFIDQTGKFVIEPKYDNVLPFQEGLAAVNEGYRLVRGNADQSVPGTWGFINVKGEIIVPLQYQNVENFQEGLAKVNIGASFRSYQGITLMGGKWGFIDKTGKYIIAPNDTLFGGFSEGLCAFKIPKGSNWGYIDRNNKVVIKAGFYEAGQFKNGFAPVLKEDFTAIYIDKTGNAVFGKSFKKAFPFREERAFVRLTDGKAAFVNTKGEIIKAPEDVINDDNLKVFYYQGLVRVPVETQYGVRNGFADLSGKWKILPTFDLADNFHEGLALVLADRYYRFIDEAGKTVIEIKDKYVENPQTGSIFKAIPNPNIGIFNHGLCRIKDAGKWGFMDMKGNIVIAPQFEDAKEFTSAE
jgi:hypothetical protein